MFIEGMKGPYGFDIAPRFWELIDEMIEVGRIACPTRVLGELLDGQDDLSTWARERRSSGLFIAAEPAVQEASAGVSLFRINVRVSVQRKCHSVTLPWYPMSTDWAPSAASILEDLRPPDNS